VAVVSCVVVVISVVVVVVVSVSLCDVVVVVSANELLSGLLASVLLELSPQAVINIIERAMIQAINLFAILIPPQFSEFPNKIIPPLTLFVKLL
jgi:hypothetical protein